MESQFQKYLWEGICWFPGGYMNKFDTPPKINIEPENDGLEDDFQIFLFQGVYSHVPC